MLIAVAVLFVLASAIQLEPSILKTLMNSITGKPSSESGSPRSRKDVTVDFSPVTSVFDSKKSIVPAKLTLRNEILLGKGLFSNVYLGDYNNAAVAIKYQNSIRTIEQAIFYAYKDVPNQSRITKFVKSLPILLDNEKQLMGEIQHPNIVSFIGHGLLKHEDVVINSEPKKEERNILVYEYCKGTLAQHLNDLQKQHIKLSVKSFVEIAHQLGSAVHYLQVEQAREYYNSMLASFPQRYHSESEYRVCHLDLSINNVMNCVDRFKSGFLRKPDVWKLIDFGLSQRDCRNFELYYSGSGLFMAPEVKYNLIISGPFDGYQADVYSLGQIFLALKETREIQNEKDLKDTIRKYKLKLYEFIRQLPEYQNMVYRYGESTPKLNLADQERLDGYILNILGNDESAFEIAQIHLILKMIKKDPKERYTIMQVMDHPLFQWASTRTIITQHNEEVEKALRRSSEKTR